MNDTERTRLLVRQLWNIIGVLMEEIGCHPMLIVTCMHVSDSDEHNAKIAIDWERGDDTAEILQDAVRRELVKVGAVETVVHKVQ